MEKHLPGRKKNTKQKKLGFGNEFHNKFHIKKEKKLGGAMLTSHKQGQKASVGMESITP